MIEKSYWLGFSAFSGIGPGKFGKLLEEFGSAEKAWGADSKSLEKMLGKALTPKFIEFRKKFSIPNYENELKKAKVSYLILGDKDYPKLLKKIKKPPFVLYVKGKFDFNSEENERSIAIVGTRKITEYGKSVTESLTADLVNAGFVIVSGLALGVDATAHRTTLGNQGKTIAVLGCGVDCVSPRENTALYNSIIENKGVILSEVPLGEPPSKGSFPSRNRIIAGLSRAVIVTEGASGSGALYTAEDALAANRPVFAVPGPITSSLSKGPNSLIAKGAKLISSAKDVVDDLGFMIKDLSRTAKNLRGETKEEQKIIDLLMNENLHFDEIAKRTGIKSSKLGTVLSMMEMKSVLKAYDGGEFGLV